MRLSIDLDTFSVSNYQGTEVTSLVSKRGDKFYVEVGFTSEGVGVELPRAAEGRLVLKKPGDFSGTVYAGSVPFPPGESHWRKVGYGEAAVYVMQLDLDTIALRNLFTVNGSVLPRVSLGFEVEWIVEDGGLAQRYSSKSVQFFVDNDYVRPAGELGGSLIEDILNGISSPANGDFIQRRLGAWVNRSVSQVKSEMAIDRVDNTEDINKPISTSMQAALDGKAAQGHTHVKADVEGLAETLSSLESDVDNLKTAVADKSSIDHSHEISDVNSLSEALDGKASVSHGHAISEITDLQTALDSKVSLVDGVIPSDKLPSYVDDVVEFSDLSNLQFATQAQGARLSGKIYVTTDNSKTYRWSGSSYVQISPSEVSSVCSKKGAVVLDVGDITGLQGALDGKMVGTGVIGIVKLTAQEYSDTIIKEPGVLYVIVDSINYSSWKDAAYEELALFGFLNNKSRSEILRILGNPDYQTDENKLYYVDVKSLGTDSFVYFHTLFVDCSFGQANCSFE